jgi:DNA-binding MurR/RpiR family transcriptional regulator
VTTSRETAALDVTRPAASILIRVRGALPNLRPAEIRVAEAVLDSPGRVSESSISKVARQCQTSETTVLRFCRAIGLAGYPELRLALARAAQDQESDRPGTPRTGVIGAGDTLAEVVAKITHADAQAIADTGAALDLTMLEAAVEALTRARRIDIYGIGSSALVGHDLHLKLHRLGLVSFMWWEGDPALTSAGVLGPYDAAIGISHTGTTAGTIASLQTARRQGATTIAITNFSGSPLAVGSDILLTTAARETTFRAGVLASRVAQLSLIECLYAGVAHRSHAAAVEALENMYTGVQSRAGVRQAN